MADSKLDPNKSYGWTGKILRVNLTDKTVSVSPTDPYKEYLGGMGIANKIMYDEVPAGTDPLSPENKIVFAVGPLTATGVPLAGRTTIASLSTYTTDHQVVDAHTGGMIGAAIKKAGWDAIVIEGASDEPVYLKIDDDDIEIKPADQVWGQGTRATTEALSRKEGTDFCVATIGPAGENLLPYACIINSRNHSAGAGAAAVMGSKKLKALVVRGSQPIYVADPQEVADLSDYMLREIVGSNNNHVVPSTQQEWAEYFDKGSRWTAQKGLTWALAEGGPIDTGGMDVAFKYLISEYYSRDMSIKTKSAKYAKMQRGEYQSKICPYGYRKSADGKMEPDPEAAAVVQFIFQLAAEGINATAITRELFRRNIPTPGQYKAAHGNHTHDISRCHGIWSTSTILRILEDERYTGVYVIGKRAVLEVGGNRSRLKDRESWYIIPDHHPAIIEKAVFDTVQASQLRFSQPNKKKRDYPLKGKAFCGCCSHALSRTMQKTSYYHCRHSEADVESRCHKMRLNAAELEQAVFLTLKKQMEAAAPLAPDGSLRVDASVPERTEYEQQIEALQDGKRALYERYLMGEIDLNTYKAEKTACDELLLKTKNAYAAVLAQAKKKQDEQARQDSRKEASKAIFDADTLTTELAELLIDRVLVYPDKRIEIAYKIQDIFD